MFYCRECKKSVNASSCPTCGKVFTAKDEVVNCPNCNKMYFKPSSDFQCKQCGTLVQVSQQGNNAQQFVPPIPQTQNNFNGAQTQNFAPPNPFANDAQAQQALFGQQTIGQTQPQVQQQATNNFVQSNSNQMPNAFDVNQQQNQFQAQSQVNPNVQNQNLVMGANTFNQNVSTQPIQQNADINPNLQVGQNADQNLAQSQTDFVSLFGSNSLNLDNQGQEEKVDFNNLRSQQEGSSNENSNVDENGYEIVDMSKDKKSKKKKGKKSDEFANDEDKPKSSKGMKIFAFIELFLLIACLACLGYLTLGKYIMTDPCQRAWSEYANAYTLVIGEDDVKDIRLVKDLVSEDGKFMIYQVEGENPGVVVFEIEKKFSISTFFDMSEAKIKGTYEKMETAIEAFPSIKWVE